MQEVLKAGTVRSVAKVQIKHRFATVTCTVTTEKSFLLQFLLQAWLFKIALLDVCGAKLQKPKSPLETDMPQRKVLGMDISRSAIHKVHSNKPYLQSSFPKQ